MSTPAERATLFHELLTPYATAIRSQRYAGYEPDAVEQAARRERLVELAELLNASQSERYDVDEQVDRWIETHPLALTGTGVKRVIDSLDGFGNGVVVGVQIGTPGEGGRYYPLNADQFTAAPIGRLLLTLPDAIAEEFRQQGRRALRREFAALMAVESLT